MRSVSEELLARCVGRFGAAATVIILGLGRGGGVFGVDGEVVDAAVGFEDVFEGQAQRVVLHLQVQVVCYVAEGEVAGADFFCFLAQPGYCGCDLGHYVFAG